MKIYKSLACIIFVNLLTLYLAIKENLGNSILWVFFFQVVIILFFGLMKFKFIKNYETSYFIVNHVRKKATPAHATFLFGTFYFLFTILLYLSLKNIFPITITKSILILVLAFFLNHLFSFIQNKEGLKQKQNLNKIFFSYLKRLLPLYLLIFLAIKLSFFANKIILFILIKMLIDVGAHFFQHLEKKGIVKVNY